MLDGKRYFGAFPDEASMRPRGRRQSLLSALAALEDEFRQKIEQRRGDPALSGAAGNKRSCRRAAIRQFVSKCINSGKV